MAEVLGQYMTRCPDASQQLEEQEVAGWAAALRERGAAPALRRAVEVLRAQAAEAAAGAEASPPDPLSQVLSPSGGGSVAAAVEQVASGIQAAEAALCTAPLDPASAQLLRQCSARLAQLLGRAV